MRLLQFLLCFLISCSAVAQTSYTTTLVDMKVAGARPSSYEGAGMNNAGQITATLDYGGCESDYYRAAAFDKTGALVSAYGTLVADPLTFRDSSNGCLYWPNSLPGGINSSGQIVGTTDKIDSASPGQVTQVAALFQNGAVTDLNTLVTGGASYLSLASAYSINDNGQIVGVSHNSSGFLLSAGVVTDLGSFIPMMINNKGQIVGRTVTNYELMIYDSGSFIDLGVTTFGQTSNMPPVMVINNLGHVAAAVLDPNVGISSSTAVFWDGTKLTTIGSADIGSNITLNNTDQIAYNDRQQNTWIWSPTSTPFELNPLISFSGSNWVLPVAMNDSGELLLQVPAYGAADYILATPAAAATAQSTSPVQVGSGGMSLQFPTVTSSGTTTVTSVAPSTVGSVPSGFTAVGQAFLINSTATYTVPVTLTFTAPGPLSQADFNSLQVTHYISGQVDPNCCTVASRDYPTLTLQILTNSFSPFMLVRKTPPTISGASDVKVSATSAAGAFVSYTVTATAASSGGAASVACLPVSGSRFSLGATNVACTATDSQGLTSQAHFKVAVADTIPPVLQLPPSPLVVSASNWTGAVVNYNVSATDNIDGVLNVPFINCNPDSGNLFPIGATTVTCTGTDHSGNASHGSFIVIVGGSADVAIAVVPASAQVMHNTVSYGIGIANLGPSTAYATTFTASLPTGVSLQNAAGATCSSSRVGVTCVLGTMKYKSGVLIALKLNVNVVGRATLTSYMSVQATNPDPRVSNNSAAVQIKFSH